MISVIQYGTMFAFHYELFPSLLTAGIYANLYFEYIIFHICGMLHIIFVSLNFLQIYQYL